MTVKTRKDEAVIGEYMNVLRETHKKIGEFLLNDRLEAKNTKKFENINFVKNQANIEKSSKSLKQKIKQMRKQKIFPQPKSYTNYRRRNGLIKKDTIRIDSWSFTKIIPLIFAEFF